NNLNENPMSSEFEQNLEKYIDVILKIGVNLQKGQRLLIVPYGIGTDLIEIAPFVELITKKAYQMGARFVEVLWNDPQLHLIRIQHAPRDSFEEHAIWRRDALLEFAEKGEAVLIIYTADPNLFIDQDPELMAIVRKTSAKHLKTFADLMWKPTFNWTFATAPIERWIEILFPDLSPEKRESKMWNIIFDICRVKQKDPVSAWNDHLDHLNARKDYLNHKHYTAMKLKAPGTDLTIGLPKAHIWQGGCMKIQNGISFVPNLPTEEIFTVPHKDKTEGVVVATKPLHEQVMIEDFILTFSKGKVVELTAKKGEKMLQKILEIDEGSSRLGEIALVPHISPISQSGLLFYNMLIDENASCHIALGKGITFALENGVNMSNKEFMATGGNDSLIHVDFMIGSDKMNIDGITEDGTAEAIMRNGEWAFEV
ncbi:MAG: aminopeptidase, partial [Candidatus Thorarchaeota archaeon]